MLQEEKAHREQLEAKLAEAEQAGDAKAAAMKATLAAQLAAELALRQQAEARLVAAQQQVGWPGTMWGHEG